MINPQLAKAVIDPNTTAFHEPCDSNQASDVKPKIPSPGHYDNKPSSHSLSELSSIRLAENVLNKLKLPETPADSFHVEAPAYGNQFPYQEKPANDFIKIHNTGDTLTQLLRQARASENSFSPKHNSHTLKSGHNRDDLMEAWNAQIAKINKDGNFNGDQAVVYLTNAESPHIKIIASDFAMQSLSRSRGKISESEQLETPTLRTTFHCGSAAIILTADNKIVLGSRNGKPMFSAGFLFGDKNKEGFMHSQLNAINNGENTLEALGKQGARKERREEVYDEKKDGVESWCEPELIGAAGERYIWPSKKEQNHFQKPVIALKTLFYLQRTKLSSEQLKSLHGQQDTDKKDFGNFTVIELEDLQNKEYRDSFILEHAQGAEMAAEYLGLIND